MLIPKRTKSPCQWRPWHLPCLPYPRYASGADNAHQRPQITAKFICIVQWNANGLHRHEEEVQLLLDQNAIDVLLISETHFTDKNYFHLPRYNMYQTNHPDGTAHGGTATLIKQSINHYELPKYETKHIQATWVKVKALPYEMTVSALYCPPRRNLKSEHFESFFETLGSKFIAGRRL
jgi:exonuclease III